MLEQMTDWSNRSVTQTERLLDMLEWDYDTLAQLELRLTNNHVGYCPGDIAEADRVMSMSPDGFRSLFVPVFTAWSSLADHVDSMKKGERTSVRLNGEKVMLTPEDFTVLVQRCTGQEKLLKDLELSSKFMTLSTVTVNQLVRAGLVKRVDDDWTETDMLRHNMDNMPAMFKFYTYSCQVCSEDYLDAEPQMCCSGRECGCQGRPVDPMVCSVECYNKLIKHEK